ncbi:MAG TPA: DUF1684 domain-containing protein [Anaerolineae bacterium]|nr:DUF1684 domain-containing protein [Anaerolineae bacterium]
MSDLELMRREKNDYFKHDPYSPISPEQRKTFQGLRYYPENPALRLVTTIAEYPDKPRVTMATSTGEVRPYLKYGQFTFEVNGASAALQVYQDTEQAYFFLPFVDATAGEETYESGRYLEIEPAGGGKFLIDFNMAYNPYCAYSPQWSCPIPPKENRLSVKIEAGEKKYHE